MMSTGENDDSMKTTEGAAPNTAPTTVPTTTPPAWHRWLDVPLRRSRSHHAIGGVIGGLSESFRFDLSLGRIIAGVTLLVTGGTAFWVYLGLWLLLPKEPEPPVSVRQLSRQGRSRWIAAALVVFGLLALGGSTGLDTAPGGPGNLVWAALLIGGGALLWKTSHAPPAVPSGTHPEGTSMNTGEPPAHLPWLPGTEPWVNSTPMATVVESRAVKRRQAREARPPITRYTLAAALALLGLGVAGDRLGWYHLSGRSTLSILLLPVGVGLVLGAFRGGGRALVLVAAMLLPALLLADNVNIDGGTRFYGAEAAAGIDRAAGRLVVDLTQLPSGKETVVPINLGAGEVDVTVGTDVDVVVQANLGIGSLVVFGERADGEGVTFGTDFSRRYDVVAERLTVVLKVDIGAGRVEIRRAGATR